VWRPRGLRAGEGVAATAGRRWGGEPPRADRSKKRRAPRGGGGDGTSGGGRRNESEHTASQPARLGYVAGWWEGVAGSHGVEE